MYHQHVPEPSAHCTYRSPHYNLNSLKPPDHRKTSCSSHHLKLAYWLPDRFFLGSAELVSKPWFSQTWSSHWPPLCCPSSSPLSSTSSRGGYQRVEVPFLGFLIRTTVWALPFWLFAKCSVPPCFSDTTPVSCIPLHAPGIFIKW